MEIFQSYVDLQNRSLAIVIGTTLAPAQTCYDPISKAMIPVPAYTPPPAGTTPLPAPPAGIIPMTRQAGCLGTVLVCFVPGVPEPAPGENYGVAILDLASGAIVQPSLLAESIAARVNIAISR